MSSYLQQFNYQFLNGSVSSTSAPRNFVFLHGLMGYGANWRRIISGLNQSDTALIYDQRGHGKSIKPMTGYSPEDYADDLELIRQEIGWEDFFLVGHSMGGRNALMYASRFPERVKRLLIEDIGPEAKPHSANFYRKMLDSVPTPFADKRAAKEFFYNTFPSLGFFQDQPTSLGQYLYSNIIENESGQADWRFSKEAMIMSVALGREKDHWAELRSLEMPTMIVRGANSKELTQDVYILMLDSNSYIEGVEIDNAGHWVHSDQPEAFIQVMRSFFDF